MQTLRRYASRLLAMHLAVTLIGLVALLQLLDLLNNADDIAARHGNSLHAVLKYTGLRLPGLISFILPFAVLIAALLTLARLARNNEVLALKAGGLSFHRLLLGFVPVTILIGALHFLLNDQVVPVTSRALQEWDADSADDLQDSNSTTAGYWARDGNTFIHVGAILDDGKELHDITLFVRGTTAELIEQITAVRAVHNSAIGWTLFDAQRLFVKDANKGPSEKLAEMPWSTALTPSHFANLAADPNSLSFRELWNFVANPDIGNKPADFYQTWLQRKLAVPLSAFLMLLLAAPVAQGTQRHGGIAAGLALGVGLGFLYFVTEGMMLTLGETGAIAPSIAAWSPTFLFGALGAASLLRIEGY
jgi:lipopolysaccharide export system permease protein